IAELLLDSGLDYKGETEPLFGAVMAGSVKLVKRLIGANADIHGAGAYSVPWDRESSRYGTPLAAAADTGNEKLVQLFLDAGANPNRWSVDVSGSFYEWEINAPLTKAIKFGTHASSSSEVQRATTIAQKLLNAGADIHARGDDALCQLIKAWPQGEDDKLGHMTLLKFLLDNGADVNGQCGPEFGTWAVERPSILCWAAVSGDTNLVQILLDHGTDINGKNSKILSYPARTGDGHMVEFLLDNGADI
ncbi:ankyrin repeat-containing domain protein, partial [Thelonectria olida]